MPTFEVLAAHGVDAARWQSYVDLLPHECRDVILTPAYYRIQEVAGGRGRCAVYGDGEAFVIQPFMHRDIAGSFLTDITSPYGFGGPFVGHHNVGGVSESAIVELWKLFDAEFSKWRANESVVSEYCALPPHVWEYQAVALRAAGVDVRETKEAALIRVDRSDDEILADAHESRRQLLGRARRDGLMAAPYDDAGGFHERYAASMNVKEAAARWRLSESYFRSHDALMPDRGVMISVGRECAAIVLFGGRIAHYHFAARAPKASPGSGEMLIMAACRAARIAGATWLNLGGGLTSSHDDSLWKYKSSWTPHRAAVRHYTRIFDQAAYESLTVAASQPLGATWFPAYRAGEAS